MNIDLKIVNNFYNINNSNINSIIRTTLNALQNRRIIDFKDTIMVKYKDNRTARNANLKIGEIKLIILHKVVDLF